VHQSLRSNLRFSPQPFFHQRRSILKRIDPGPPPVLGGCLSPPFGGGYLQYIEGIASILGALLYYRVFGLWSLKTLLPVCIVLAAFSSIGYLFYDTKAHAIAIMVADGLFGGLLEISLTQLWTSAIPIKSEVLGFAVATSLMNIASSVADYSASWLIAHHVVGFHRVVWLNGLATIFIGVTVFCRSRLVRTRDARQVL
jgi:hypothetical protein